MRATAQPACRKLGDLVFHERDQRADDQRGAAARDGGQLVAERLAGAGRHHQQHIAARNRGAADLFLVGAEGREAEGAGEQGAERQIVVRLARRGVAQRLAGRRSVRGCRF